MKEVAISSGAGSLLLAAAAFGVGGPAIGLHLALRSPAWCSVPFAGCLMEGFLFAAGGWLLGLCAAAIALRTKCRKDVAWVLVAWNVGGTLLCAGAFFSIL